MCQIVAEGLCKRFGPTTVLEDVTFSAPAGAVTGFFGANGAGKSTTLRLLLGLSPATAGTATIGGRAYGELEDPLRTVGAVLEHTPFHPGRTAGAALSVLATAAGIPRARVDEALRAVELKDVADARVGRFSLGMRQRLALAAALLGDPSVLVLDEPTNGLDPPGLRWMRDWLRAQASAGRTVFLSSHLLAEMAECVDRAVVIAGGRITFEGEIAADEELLVRAVDPDALAASLAQRGIETHAGADALLRVVGASAEHVGAVAAEHGIALLELRARHTTLEDSLQPYLIAEERTPCAA